MTASMPRVRRNAGTALPARIAAALLAVGAGSAGAAEVAAGPPVTFLRSPDGVPLCVAEAGNPRGVPIVFIHGFSQSYAVFARQFDSPLAAEFRLIAPDLRGHGCSGKPWEESAYASPRPWANDIASVLRAKAAGRAVLVGWSAGGFWITDYVREHGTAAIAGIVLVGSGGGLTPPPTDPAALARMEAGRAANRNFPAEIPAAIGKADEFAKLMAAAPLPADLARVMATGPLMQPAYARRAMAARPLADNSGAAALLDRPVLFIVGEADPIADPAVVRAVAARVKGARVLGYPSTGHSPFAEQPERFNADLAGFAREVAAEAAPAAPPP
jgi:pimeloyl-ACP methyl ester carboxylesterase